jgi:hypothetical protein
MDEGASGAAASVRRELLGGPIAFPQVANKLPRSPGLYAWWAERHILPDLPGLGNDKDGGLRLLYVGLAANLRRRILDNHLKRSGSSTLRRTLAGLLLHQENYRTMWTDRVILVPDDEQRLTAWMTTHLQLTFAEHPEPSKIELELIAALRPPLNVNGTTPGHLRARIVAAKADYATSAGPRPSHRSPAANVSTAVDDDPTEQT